MKLINHRTVLRAMPFLLALMVFQAVAAGEIIRLKNGVELHGKVVEFDNEVGITVQRYDNGGVLDLRWEHILDADVKALRLARGYGDEEAAPIFIKAKKMLLINNEYVIGVPVESSRPGFIALRRLGKIDEYPQAVVKEMETIDVEVQEVFTLEELFQQKLSEGIPETALDHFNLGVFCESIEFYDRALELFMAVTELDPEFKADLIIQKVKRMEVKIREKEATDLLRDIRNRIYKKMFSTAFEFCDKFVEEYPDSVQMGDLEKLRAQAVSKRRQYYQTKILTDYFSYLDRIATKVSSHKEYKLDDALSYARDELGSDVRKKLSEEFDMEIEEIEDLWLNRKGGRHRTASYGEGTFILGDEATLMPVEDEDDDKKKEAKEPATLDEKLKQKIEGIRKSRDRESRRRRSRINVDDVGQTPDQWWMNAKEKQRRSFLLAYYAENSGDMKIVKVRLMNCPYCCGKGYFEHFTQGTEGESNKEVCTVCKTIKYYRVVLYK